MSGRKRRATTAYESSTPHKNLLIKQYSISLSEIDTGSSSSAGLTRKSPLPQIPKERKITTRTKRKRVKSRPVNTDSEWETTQELVEETSVNSPEFNSKRTREECQNDRPVRRTLFEEPHSSRQFRDQPIANTSPILRSSRRLRPIPVDTGIVQREKASVSRVRFSKQTHEKCQNDSPVRRTLFEEPHSSRKFRDQPIANTPPILRSSRKLGSIPVDTGIVQREKSSVSRVRFSKQTHEKCQNDSPVPCALFEEMHSPEKTRDAPIVNESPILRSSQRLHPIPVEIDIAHHEKSLPVLKLRLLDARDATPEEIDDDLPIFDCKRVKRTYPFPRKESPITISPIKTYKHCKFRMPFQKGNCDVLVSKFIDQFTDELNYYLESPATRSPVKMKYDEQGLPYVVPRRKSKPVASNTESICERWYRIKRRPEIRSNSKRVNDSERGNSKRRNEHQIERRKVSRKFREVSRKVRERDAPERVRKATASRSEQKQKADKVYNHFDETDNEFETGGQDKRRIGFREFCRKQNINKTITSETSYSQ